MAHAFPPAWEPRNNARILIWLIPVNVKRLRSQRNAESADCPWATGVFVFGTFVFVPDGIDYFASVAWRWTSAPSDAIFLLVLDSCLCPHFFNPPNSWITEVNQQLRTREHQSLPGVGLDAMFVVLGDLTN